MTRAQQPPNAQIQMEESDKSPEVKTLTKAINQAKKAVKNQENGKAQMRETLF